MLKLNKMKLIAVKLTQFKDYRTCGWVKSLVFYSKDFFDKSEVLNGTLFLEIDEPHMDRALNLLNEASSMDFIYQVYTSGSIAGVKEIVNN